MRYNLNKYLLPAIFIMAIQLNAQSWELSKLSPMPMKTANNSVIEAFVGGEAYVYSFAGIDSSKIYSGLHLRSFKYSVSDDEWNEIESLPDDRGKIACSASRVGDVIYIIGGYYVAQDGSEISSKKVHRYNVVNDAFLEDGAEIPVAIDDQVQVVNGEYIYVVTGWSNSNNISLVQVYNTLTDEWSQATPVGNSNDYRVFGSAGTILENTIYYYGGATLASNFAAANVLRKGIINPDNPLDISWSLVSIDSAPFLYRPASVSMNNKAFWIGGSAVSYNFDGIAYNGSGGVSPTMQILEYDPITPGILPVYNLPELPMDLRSLAKIDTNTVLVAGGMLENQEVTDQLIQLRYMSGPSRSEEVDLSLIKVYPNPAQEELIFSSGSYQGLDYKIISMDGMLMRKGALEERIRIDGLPSGMYNVVVIENQHVVFSKQISKH